MKINIQEQELEIDLEEIAYRCANGDIIASGQMVVNFLEHLEKREKDSGYSDLPFFDTFFGMQLEYMSEPHLDRLKELVEKY